MTVKDTKKRKRLQSLQVTMKKDFTCCCPSLILSRETACFYLLCVLIALYMLAGAAIFSSLERPAELKAHQLWERRLRDFSHEHSISYEDLKSLLRHYEEARAAGIGTEQGRALWDIPGAFYFVGTVVSTIGQLKTGKGGESGMTCSKGLRVGLDPGHCVKDGASVHGALALPGFGVTAPSTVTGKVLLVFYGLMGCSATILFFNLFLERVITLLSLLIFWCHRKRIGHSGKKGRGSEDNKNEEWKPSVYQVTLILFVAVLLVACSAASLYSAMEGWTYIESLYFCFVAFSTVGFGDFVSCQRGQHEDTWAYQIANCLLMLLGVCCTYSLFNTISVIIKQGLNLLLKTLVWLYSVINHNRLQLRPLFKLCFTASEPTIFYCEDDTLRGQQVQAVSSSGHGMMWHSYVPNATGKCLCDEAQVEIVCQRELDSGISAKQEKDNCSIYARPLPTQSQ